MITVHCGVSLQYIPIHAQWVNDDRFLVYFSTRFWVSRGYPLNKLLVTLFVAGMMVIPLLGSILLLELTLHPRRQTTTQGLKVVARHCDRCRLRTQLQEQGLVICF